MENNNQQNEYNISPIALFVKALLILVCVLVVILSYQFSVLQSMVVGTIMDRMENQNRQLQSELKRIGAEVNLAMNDPDLKERAFSQLNLNMPRQSQIVAIYDLVELNQPKYNGLIYSSNTGSSTGERLLKSIGIYQSNKDFGLNND